MTDEELIAMISGLDTISGLRGMDAEIVQNARAAITTLRAQLAEANHMLSLSKLTTEAVLDRADRAEAALEKWRSDMSAVIPADCKDWASVPAPETAAEIMRNLQEREVLAWEIAADARERTLRDAADAYFIPKFCTDNDRERVEALHDFRAAILALIERENTK